MKNLMYAVIALLMLYFGLQQMTLTGDHMQTVFAMSWFCLALFVIGGNFASYLYRPKKQDKTTAQQVKIYKKNTYRKKQRQTVR